MSILTYAKIKALLQLEDDSLQTVIETLIPLVQEHLFDICKNHFDSEVSRITTYDMIFDADAKTITLDSDLDFDFNDFGFKAGLIYVKDSLKNDGIKTVTDVTDNVLTVSDTTYDEDVENDGVGNYPLGYMVTLATVEYPAGIGLAFAKMIDDQIKFLNSDGNYVEAKSEKIGDHSISYGAGFQDWVASGYSVGTLNMLKPYMKYKMAVNSNRKVKTY